MEIIVTPSYVGTCKVTAKVALPVGLILTLTRLACGQLAARPNWIGPPFGNINLVLEGVQKPIWI